MRVQHNIMSMNAYRNYNNNTSALSKNLEKLSSGYAINRAGDDAAGLAISEKMRAQITGLDVAQSNSQDGISLIKTAEGALTEVHDMLNRMYELAEKSANGTFDASDRMEMQKEIDALKTEIDRISDTANFNGIKLLDGTMGRELMGTGAVAVANGIESITFSGGGEMVEGVKVSASMNADGTVTITITDKDGKAITGITVKAVGGGAGAAGVSGSGNVGGAGGAQGTGGVSGSTVNTASSKIEGTKGGSVEFEISFDASVSGAKPEYAKMFEGMKITVNVDSAKADGTYGTSAFSGTIEANGLKLQIGDDASSSNQLTLEIDSASINSLGISGVKVTTQSKALAALDTIKAAITKVSDIRGSLGAVQNRLEHTINNLSVTEENISAAESSIRDTDVADEMMAYTKNNILIQSAQAMLAQANQVPQGVLQLLQ